MDFAREIKTIILFFQVELNKIAKYVGKCLVIVNNKPGAP